MKKSTLHIHVSNVSEDVGDFVATLPSKQQDFEIAENAELSDRDLFCFTDVSDLILLVPKQVNSDFVAYYAKLFPKNRLDVLYPRKHTGLLSLDILNDASLLEALDERIRSYGTVILTSYSSTNQFEELYRKFKARYSSITGPETPEDNWVVDFFGSKMGFRQLGWQEKIPQCEGSIVYGVKTARSLAKLYENEFPGVVLKTNKGHAGMGVVILKKGELGKLDEKLQEDYWKKFPIVVEEFIPSDSKVGGGFPNAECFVSKTGKVQYLYSCGMRVSKEGNFKGVEIGKGALTPGVEKLLRQYGEIIGRAYAKDGYAGYFDVDCIYGKNKKLYVSESNVRRTGGTHVYLCASAMFGNDFESKTYALSNNLYQIKNKKPRSFTQLTEQLEPILFDPKTKEGLLIVAANLLYRAVFGYIIFGDTKQRAYKIEEKMEALLAQ